MSLYQVVNRCVTTPKNNSIMKHTFIISQFLWIQVRLSWVVGFRVLRCGLGLWTSKIWLGGDLLLNSHRWWQDSVFHSFSVLWGWKLKVFSVGQRPSSIPCHWTSPTWQLASSKPERVSASKTEVIAFYNLTTEVTPLHLCQILLVRSTVVGLGNAWEQDEGITKIHVGIPHGTIIFLMSSSSLGF